MTFLSKVIAPGLAATLVVFSGSAEAKKKSPATVEQMWNLIQQQQKQIEALQAKIDGTGGASKDIAAGSTTTISSSGAPQGNVSSVGKPEDLANASGLPAKTATKGEGERKTEILAQEVQKLKTQLNIPDKREYKSEYGLGPAASEVYRINRGLSIGGYGEWVYSNYFGKRKNTVDNLRAVLYVGYKFNDWIVLNNEFEFEHATTGEGSEEKGEVSVEFSYLDFMLKPYANVRTGLTLVPMGFINEIHEGPTYHGNYRPVVETRIIPTTWREMGAGVWGSLAPGLQYRMYAMNSLNAQNFSSLGIRDARQSGSMSIAQDFSFTGRLDYDMPFAPGVLVGASAWVGDSGQGYEYAGQKVNALTQLYEGHVQWRWKGLEMRALGAMGLIGNSAQLSEAKGETIGSQNYGWYTEVAYNVMPWLFPESTQYIAPFFRYERYNTLAKVPNGYTNYGGYFDQWIYQAGVTYKPIENVAVKLDYRNFNAAGNTPPDGLPPISNQLNLGVAFMY